MAKTPIEEKIALLLAKAESTTPEEAEALTSAAEKLMLRHGIERALIDGLRSQSSREQKIERESIHFPGHHAPEWVQLASQVAAASGLAKVYISKDIHGPGITVYMVGFTSDVEDLRTLILSLQLQALTAQKAWWKTHATKSWMDKGERWRERRQFNFSFASGAGERIAASKTEAVAEAGEGAQLMLRERADQIQEWIDENISLRSGKRSRMGGGSADAYRSGRSAGLNADTGQTRVAGRVAIGAGR